MNQKNKPKPAQNKSLKNKKGLQANQVRERGRQNIIPALIVGLLGFLLYVNTFHHNYVFDDHSVIKSNWLVQRGVKAIPDLMNTPYRYGYWTSSDNLYRPLSLVMFAVEWEISPDNPHLSHIINVLLYALTGVILFLMLRKLLPKQNMTLPFLISLIFIAHPVHTEVVANIKSRDEILSLLFVLLTMLFVLQYVRRNSRYLLLLSVVMYFFAFLSKESAITLLAVVPLMLYFFTNLPFRRIAIITGCLCLSAVVYLIIRKNVMGGVTDLSDNVSIIDNVMAGVAKSDTSQHYATAFLILGKYLLLLFFPHPLVSDYSFNQIQITGWSNIGVILSFLTYAGIGVYAVLKIKNKSLPVFGILFFLITMSLYSNLFIIIGTSFAERLLFLPSLGFAIVLSHYLVAFFKVNTFSYPSFLSWIKQNKILWMLVVPLLFAYSFKTVDRNRDWKDNFTLYEEDVKKSPNSTRAHYNYGLELMKEKAMKTDNMTIRFKYLDSAIFEFRKALQIHSTYSDAYDQIGLAYFRQNNFPKAVEYYNLSLKYNPTRSITYSNLGAIYFNSGDFQKAMEVYEKAVQYDPRFADGYMNLGSTYATLGRMNDAIRVYLKGLEYNPGSDMLNYFLGITYQKTGDQTNANFYLQKAYQINPALRNRN